jgi:hypothetical protein
MRRLSAGRDRSGNSAAAERWHDQEESLMWYRVEFNKDGSIKDSRRVDAVGTGTGLVCYIDADSASAAATAALAWRMRYLERVRIKSKERLESARANGRCRHCKKNKCIVGAVLCPRCAKLNQARRKASYVVSHAVALDERLVDAVHGSLPVGNRPARESLREALAGTAVSRHVASDAVVGMRALGHDARSECTQKMLHPGRRSERAIERELLVVVRALALRETTENLIAWLDREIGARSEDPKNTEAA